LQYSTSQQPGRVTNSVDSLSHFFDSNWMLGSHFTWRDRDSVTMFYSEDVLRGAYLFDLSYERVVRENLTLGLGATVLGGPSISALGAFDKNDNATASLKYTF
jgi:hypothetical protein